MIISIIIPIYNEEKYIDSCLSSIVRSDIDKNGMEVFVVDGKSTDNTSNIVKEYCEKYPYIKLIINSKRIVPCAMNIAIKKAKGDFIIRLDAHSEYPPDYISKLIESAQKLDADNVGGICITKTRLITDKTKAIVAVLSNKFGVGNSYFRTGSNEIKEVDTVPFGCYKKEVFEKYGLYDERLERNQDIELNKRIKRGGGKLFLVPEIKCTYYARETYRALAKNNYQNGMWNIYTCYYTKKLSSLSFRHFIPLILVLSLLLPLLISILIWPPIIYISIASLTAYVLFVSIISIMLSIKDLSFIYLFAGFTILHLSYGFGSMIGLFHYKSKH